MITTKSYYVPLRQECLRVKAYTRSTYSVNRDGTGVCVRAGKLGAYTTCLLRVGDLLVPTDNNAYVHLSNIPFSNIIFQIFYFLKVKDHLLRLWFQISLK